MRPSPGSAPAWTTSVWPQRSGPASMTLGGLLRHQARSEDYWFCHQLLGRDIAMPWDSLDWASDWGWHSAGDTPEDLWALWEENVKRSRAALEEVLLSEGLHGVVRRPPPSLEPASVRWVLCHMIEEYARHNGHADLLASPSMAEPESERSTWRMMGDSGLSSPPGRC